MATDPNGFALLLDGIGLLERDLARNLLESAGIPCLVDEPDLIEGCLGALRMPGVTRIYVPPSALARARSLLGEAWGDPERFAAGAV